MRVENRVAARHAGGLQDVPPAITVVDGDGEVIMHTLSWAQAKACSEQWVDLGYPAPQIVVRLHS